MLNHIYETPIKMTASKAKTKDYDKRPVPIFAEMIAIFFYMFPVL